MPHHPTEDRRESFGKGNMKSPAGISLRLNLSLAGHGKPSPWAQVRGSELEEGALVSLLQSFSQHRDPRD